MYQLHPLIITRNLAFPKMIIIIIKVYFTNVYFSKNKLVFPCFSLSPIWKNLMLQYLLWIMTPGYNNLARMVANLLMSIFGVSYLPVYYIVRR